MAILSCYAQLYFGQWLTVFMILEPKYSPNDVVFILIYVSTFPPSQNCIALYMHSICFCVMYMCIWCTWMCTYMLVHSHVCMGGVRDQCWVSFSITCHCIIWFSEIGSLNECELHFQQDWLVRKSWDLPDSTPQCWITVTCHHAQILYGC